MPGKKANCSWDLNFPEFHFFFKTDIGL